MPQTISAKDNKLLFSFVIAWLIINMIQACFVGLDGDEAYYWTYTLHLQWGYFDHPPMVALGIKLGELFGHGYLYTRFGTILLSSATIYFGFKALPENLQNVRWYLLAFASVVFFHIYSFVVTPDAPLLFFTAVFFYAYRLYLKHDGLPHILFLAFSIVGLIYSKYHGVLPVFFVFLSNPKLALKRSAWLAVVIVVIAFLPHLWWQYQHNWPTVQYHLFERGQDHYKVEKTANYILGQLLIWGPFTTIPALVLFFRKKQRDVYFRAHVFTFWGVLVFFLLNSFKKNIEPHWTLVAGISFLVLLMNVLVNASAKTKRVFYILITANIVLIIAARILLAVPGSPVKNIDRFQVQIYSAAWADSLYKKAAGTPVVFIDNYTYPALYKYYHPDQLSTCFSSVYYRKNNFTMQNDEPFNNKNVYTIRKVKVDSSDIEVKSDYVPTFLHPLDSFKVISGLKIVWLNEIREAKPGEKIKINLQLSNPLSYAISVDNDLFVNYSFFVNRYDARSSEMIPINETSLAPGFKKDFNTELIMPVTAGKYRLIFSFVQPTVGPNFASQFYDVEVKK
jgi:hypothetical protein